MAIALAFISTTAITSSALASPPRSTDYDSTIERALMLEKAGKVDEALAEYKLAMQADPERAEPLARAAMLYMILQKPNLALSMADLAIKTEPDHRGAWLNKSVIELSSGMYKEALVTTQRSIKLFPEDTDLMNNMATAQIKLRRLNDAKDTLLMALKLKPDDSSLNYNLACTYALSDIRMTALIYLEKAITLDPSLRERARTDPDLKSIRDLKPFKELTTD